MSVVLGFAHDNCGSKQPREPRKIYARNNKVPRFNRSQCQLRKVHSSIKRSEERSDLSRRLHHQGRQQGSKADTQIKVFIIMHRQRSDQT